MPEFYSGATDRLGRFSEGFLLRRLQPWHFHPPAASPCPWCEIEQHARIKLYGGLIRAVPPGVADLETLWARYLALVDPAPPRPLPVLPPRPKWRPLRAKIQILARAGPRLDWLKSLPQRALQTRRITARINWAAIMYVIFAGFLAIEFNRSHVAGGGKSFFGVLEEITSLVSKVPGDAAWMALGALTIVLVGGTLSPLLSAALKSCVRVFLEPPQGPIAAQTGGQAVAHRTSRRDAKKAWDVAAEAWRALPPPPDVSHLRPPIEALKRDLDSLVQEREVAIRALAVAQPLNVQLARFLEGLRIEDAKLPGIGPARCVVLRSWGIDTAADIDEPKIATIPGFGKGLTDKLVVWKWAKEQAFTPDTAGVIDPIEVQKIDRRLAARRASLIKELRERIAGVEAAMRPFTIVRSERWSAVEKAYQTIRRI